MIKPHFEGFLQEQKSAWLNKKALGKEPKPELVLESEERYAEKTWWEKSLQAARPAAATHISTYTHPDAKTTNLVVGINVVNNGLMATSNVHCRNAFDIYGNAGNDTLLGEVYRFLYLQLPDGLTVAGHLTQDTNDIQSFFNDLGIDYSYAKERLENILSDRRPTKTHQLVKQVYFPISDNQYHLLSLLTSSVLQTELLKRINETKFSEANKELRALRREKKFTDQKIEEFFGLTEVYFGGSKPQNISVANTANYGKAYLLPSLPPKLEKRAFRLPKNDFFETLFYKSFKENFTAWHELMAGNWNNIHIRNGIIKTIQFIIDQILFKALTISKQMPEGWTDDEKYQALPKYQMIFLDRQYDDKEFKDEAWRTQISNAVGHWIIKGYEKSVKEAFLLESSEYNRVKELVESTLRTDKAVF